MKIQELVSNISKQLNVPGLDLVLDTDWASSRPDHRSRLRRFLFERFDCDESMLDTDVLPRAANAEISVSHNRAIGGFASTAPGHRIGFDIELSGRLKAENVRRVCVSDEELARAPGPDLLWSAKEAAFKALGPGRQPAVFSVIEIGGWAKATESGIHSCRVDSIDHRAPATALRGVALRWEDQALSVFVMDAVNMDTGNALGLADTMNATDTTKRLAERTTAESTSRVEKSCAGY